VEGRGDGKWEIERRKGEDENERDPPSQIPASASVFA